MGVMSCSKKGCENIMCDTYINGIGYICNECQFEFKKYLERNNLNPETEGQIKAELEKFMAVEKFYSSEVKMSVNQFFLSYTNFF